MTKIRDNSSYYDYSKYLSRSALIRCLIDGYFNSVSKLYNQIPQPETLKSALEVGCGEGFSTEKLGKILPKDCILEASDIDQKSILHAKTKNPELKIIQEDIYNLDRHDNSFDLVFLLEVLEHLTAPEKALKELKRVTKNYLILGVPREPIWRILNVTRGKYLNKLGNTPGHVQHWSTKQIVDLLESHFGTVLSVCTPLPWTILLAKPN